LGGEKPGELAVEEVVEAELTGGACPLFEVVASAVGGEVRCFFFSGVAVVASALSLGGLLALAHARFGCRTFFPPATLLASGLTLGGEESSLEEVADRVGEEVAEELGDRGGAVVSQISFSCVTLLFRLLAGGGGESFNSIGASRVPTAAEGEGGGGGEEDRSTTDWKVVVEGAGGALVRDSSLHRNLLASDSTFCWS
jgi:hypothetical protein